MTTSILKISTLVEKTPIPETLFFYLLNLSSNFIDLLKKYAVIVTKIILNLRIWRI